MFNVSQANAIFGINNANSNMTSLLEQLQTGNRINKASEITELFETKDKMITALDMLAMSSNDNSLKESYNSLASLIISTNPNTIKIALDFCSSTRA